MIWTPGKALTIAGLLSRNPIQTDDELTEGGGFCQRKFNQIVINTTDENMTMVLHSQMRDPVCEQLKHQIMDNWIKKSDIASEIHDYFSVKDELSCIDGLLFQGTRMIIPQ